MCFLLKLRFQQDFWQDFFQLNWAPGELRLRHPVRRSGFFNLAGGEERARAQARRATRFIN